MNDYGYEDTKNLKLWMVYVNKKKPDFSDFK